MVIDKHNILCYNCDVNKFMRGFCPDFKYNVLAYEMSRL